MSRNEKSIRDACAALNIKIVSIEWKNWGPELEMCGYSGGWFINEIPIGLSTEEAIESLELFKRRLNENAEYLLDQYA